LKTKPFVILTGISGTGKTKIAQIFADYICQDDTPEERGKRIAFVPVKPDWMDNKGLLGYYNLLDEKYHVTPVLRLLIEAAKNPDKPYFIILDEMNLAKVEQYFSDFLSIMESRTQDRPEGEALHLHSSGKDGGDEVPSSINIPPNVYFTGTVNIDESTYMFSPKVLDRANVIEFNDVNLAGYEKGVVTSDRFVLKNQDVRDSLLPAGSEVTFSSKSDYVAALAINRNVYTYLEELLNILRQYHLHFSYRVINEISHFIRHAHELIQHSGNVFNLSEVMDIQILQKVLPKFHGTQGKLEEPLNRLFDFCNDEDTRFPRSAEKLARMIQNLKVQGYTSFIE
jgi:5-methylcytosine-specific restriction endonuclease McrBC GTP-binding regulatory subunit McrB